MFWGWADNSWSKKEERVEMFFFQQLKREWLTKQQLQLIRKFDWSFWFEDILFCLQQPVDDFKKQYQHVKLLQER